MYLMRLIASVKKNKNIFFITGLQGGGAEKNLLEWAGIANGCGGAMVIYFSPHHYYKDRLHSIGVNVQYIPLIFNFSLARSITALLTITFSLRKSHNVFGWLQHGQFATGLIRLIAINKPRLIWCIRSDLKNIKSRSFLTQILLRGTAAMSASVDEMVSNSYAAQASHLSYGFKPKNKFVLPNFIAKRNIDALNHSDIKAFSFWRAKFDCVLCFIGRDHVDKGLDIFLEIASIILDRKLNKRFGFLILGNISIKTRERLSALNIGAYVYTPGFQSSVQIWLRHCDCLLLTSRTESLPNVVLESMLCSTFVISHDVGDVSKLLLDERFIVSVSNVRGFVESIFTFLSLSDEERSSILQNQRDLAERITDYHRGVAAIKALIGRNFVNMQCY